MRPRGKLLRPSRRASLGSGVNACGSFNPILLSLNFPLLECQLCQERKRIAEERRLAKEEMERKAAEERRKIEEEARRKEEELLV